MKILSLNCWSGRVPGLVDYLRSQRADVYCLQEVLHSSPETPDLLSFEGQGSTAEAQRAKLFTELCAALPGYHAFHLPAAQGYLHDGAKTEHKSQYGIATFVGPGIPIISSVSDFVFGKYRKDNWDPPPLPRQAHVVRMWDYEHDAALVVGHMHGLWVDNKKADTSARNDQALNFRELVRSIYRDGDGIVACGDWNVLPDSNTFEVMSELELEDLVTGHGHTDTRTSYYKKEIRFADYMMVSPSLVRCNFEVVTNPEVSDHRALVLDTK